MISLTCPQCKKEIEIDDGFRGGVCRCFSCGTLMTVPEDPAETPPEALKKPAAPTADAPRPLSKAAAAPTTFTTRSGKKVFLSTAQMKKIPVAAQKRKQKVQTAVALVLLAVSAAMIGGVVWLAIVLFKPVAPESTADIYADIFEITNNPFTWAEPNFMGLPVGASSVYVIDSSSAMRGQIDLVKLALLASLKTLGADRAAQVVFWTEGGPTVYPEGLTPAGKIDTEALAAKLESVSASGAAEAPPALALALGAKAERVVLVCRSLPEASVAEALAEPLEKSGSSLVVIHLDGDAGDTDAAAWKKLAEGSDGRYIALSSGQLRRWADEAADAEPEGEGVPAEVEAR